MGYPREYSDAETRQIASNVYFGTHREYDSGLVTVGGRRDQTHAKKPLAQPYGFRSYAPQHSDSDPQEVAIIQTEGGILVVHSRNNLPSGVDEPESGEALLYNSQGCLCKLDKNGDIKLLPKTSRFVNMGSSPEFVSLASKVDAELDKLDTAFNGHTHNYLPGPGAATATTTPSAAYVPASTAAAEVKAT